MAEFDKEIIKYVNLLNCACFNKASNYKFREFFQRNIVIISLFSLFAYFVVSNATFQFNTYLLGARETVCFVTRDDVGRRMNMILDFVNLSPKWT